MVDTVFSSDQRRTIDPGGCGTTQIGPYFYKRQSGTDLSSSEIHARYNRPSGARSKRQRAFYSPDHPYSMEYTFQNNTVISWKGAFDLNPSPGTVLSCFGLPSFGALDPNFMLDLQNKLASKIRGHEFNLAVTLGEGKETLGMITQSANRVYRSFRALRRGDFAGAGRALGLSPSASSSAGRRASRHAATGQYTDMWLEYQYGWKPLLQDTYAAANALATELYAPQRTSVRVRKTYVHSLSDPVLWAWNDAHMVTQCQIIARFTEDPLTTSQSLGLLNPSEVLWEILPYSFVFDWFLPIGTYLENRGVLSSLSGTFITSTKVEWISSGIKSGSFYTISGGEGCRFHDIRFSRDVSTTLTLATPSFVPLNKAVGWQRAVSALSLLNQRNLRFP